MDHLFATRMSRMKASEIRELLKLLEQPDIVSFAGGIPDPALFPAEAFAQAFQASLTPDQQTQALQYSVSEGYPPLRQWLAEHMGQMGIPCDIDNILITSGSQQALDYLGKLFLSPGDTALVGWPTYLGAINAFSAYEPRFDQLSVEGNMGAAEYRAAAGEGAVKFAYLSADFANPTGETTDLRGRNAVLDLADELDCAVIEDGAYQALRYDGEPIPPVLALEIARKGSIEACRTIYCGSFSKTLSPGLRLGWVVAAKSTISRLVLLKQAADLHSSTINQMAVHKVAESCFETHIPKLRSAYSARRDAMLAALDEHMPEGVAWTQPEGGMFVWVTLPKGTDGAELLEKALKTVKLAFVPGQAFFPDGSGANTIRLSFSNSDEDTIREGVRRLGQVLRA
ncbi:MULTISPECIES: PLP-dependent aminotransferase family protein [unclassified Ruegeria]|uniref:aminotransferase-like domain-containing protein n=1 Tax=unclassified Ruegeria TaxID=2625375 RepID=UPI001488684D|nr:MULTISPECIES: PLP-dependent aminotransferase family protein [unclassified Ruegeria]